MLIPSERHGSMTSPPWVKQDKFGPIALGDSQSRNSEPKPDGTILEHRLGIQIPAECPVMDCHM